MDDKQIEKEMSKCRYDINRFSYFSFPWGRKDTPLEDEIGLEWWQKDANEYIGHNLKNSHEPTRVAVRSGHSSSKTMWIATLILWFMSTRANPQIVVTANTKNQLSGKTWRELAIWHKRLIFSHWFRWSATRFMKVGHEETWFASAIPWSKENPEAFAGTHAKDVLVLFDESSSIANEIWEVVEGAMAYGECLWVTAGNPTRSSGAFFECFNSQKHLWKGYEIDSETCRHSNKHQIKQWIDTYGEDSDFVRVRVRGLPPKVGINQIIPRELAKEARRRKFHISEYEELPKIGGVDLARYGDDRSVISVRQGLCFTHLETFRNFNAAEMADVIANYIVRLDLEWVFIDLGYMPGVVDILHKQQFDNVVGINFGETKRMSQKDQELFANIVTMMYYRTYEHLTKGGSIPDDEEMYEELIAREYTYDTKGKMIIEKKDDVKVRLKRSPDKADSGVLTFANTTLELKCLRKSTNKKSKVYQDYNPLEEI